jgi:hypothetical protein
VAAAIGSDGAVTLAWYARTPDSAVVIAAWRRGAQPAPGTVVTPAGARASNLVLVPRPGGGTVAAWSETRLPSAPDQLVATAVVTPGRAVERVETLALAPGERPAAVFAGSDRAGRPSVAVKTVSTLGGGPDSLVTADSSTPERFTLEGAPRRQPLDGSGLDDLQVLTDGRGAQLAVWLSGPFNGVRRVQAAVRGRGGRFSHPRTLATGRRIQSLAAAMAASGTAGVVWTPVEGGLTPLRARFREHGRWSAAAQVTSPGRGAQQPVIGLDARGRATIAWGSLHGIRSRTWSAGRLGAAAVVSSPWRARLCWQPALTVAARGAAAATFLCTRRGTEPLSGLACRPAHGSRHAQLAGSQS